MRLNKKGMTLIELIISLALISITLIFLFKVVIDVKYEKDNPNYAVNNQIVRAEIIKTIQEDLNKMGIKKLYSSGHNDEVILEFNNGAIERKIEIKENQLTYSGNNIEKRSWTIKDNDYIFKSIDIETVYLGTGALLMLNIPVTNGLDDDLTIDDIMIIIDTH